MFPFPATPDFPAPVARAASPVFDAASYAAPDFPVVPIAADALDDFFEFLFAEPPAGLGAGFSFGDLPAPAAKRERDGPGAGPEPSAKKRRLDPDAGRSVRRVKRVKRAKGAKRVTSFRDGDIVVVFVRRPRAPRR